MKNNHILFLIILFPLLFTSCVRFTENEGVNPNLPQDAPTEQMMTALLVSHGYVFSSELPRITAIFTGQLTGSNRQFLALNSYLTDANDYDSPWENIYYLVGKQSRIVQAKAEKENNFWTLGIAQILEANAIGTAAALWGDIPYSQAFDDLRFPEPKFDSQAEVYDAVQSKLNEAIVNLNKTGISLGIRDIYYSGDKAKWIAAAHTLKARYFLHTGDHSSAISEALLGISSAAGDMKMPYNGTTRGVDMNPFFDFLSISRAGDINAQSSYALSLLSTRSNDKTDESARLKFYYAVTPTSANPNTTGKGFFSADADFPLVTFEENQLILAEGYLRTTRFEEALTELNKLRTFHSAYFLNFGTSRYELFESTDFDAGQFMNKEGVSKEDALLKEILTEKYLTLIGQVESFNDLRRARNFAGQGNVIGVPSKNPNQLLPQRLLLPQSEINANSSLDKSLIKNLFEPTEVNNRK